jgi:hypothetical protein
MNPRSILLCLLALLAIAAPPLPAQSREKLPDPKVERECVEDAKGIREWKKYDQKCPTCKLAKIRPCERCDGGGGAACPECEGTKKAKCRTCAGVGRSPNPLKEMACIYCKGSAWYRCSLCGGGGMVGARNQALGKCGSCKGKGHFSCSVCKGERRLESVRVKRKAPGKATKLKDLREVRSLLKKCLTDLEAFEPNDTIAKNEKALARILSKPSRSLPALKDMQELLETVVKGQVRAGSRFQGFEAAVTHQFLVFKDRSIYLTQYQIAVLDLCIARLEHNEKILSGGK